MGLIAALRQISIDSYMVRDRTFEVSSPAQLGERVVYKDPNSEVHYKKQKGKDPCDERAQLFKLPLGGSWAMNCENHEDFIRLGILAIKTGTHGKDPRKRIGRSLVWSLPDGIQALLWNLPKGPQKQMLLFMLQLFRRALNKNYPDVPCVFSIHCDKSRIHFEALVLKYHFVKTARGKLRSKTYEQFEGYSADSPFRTGHVATALLYGFPDPGYNETNSKMCRWLTTQVLQRITEICRALDSQTASRVAGGALETHAGLRVIRSDFSEKDRDDWNKQTFQANRQKGVNKPKAIDAFVRFMKKGGGWLPGWMEAVYARIKRIRRRRLKVLLILAALARAESKDQQPSPVPEVEDFDRNPESLGIEPDV